MSGPHLQPYGDKTPTIDPTAYVHPTAVLIGDVTIGAQCTIWPHAVLRGDDVPIVIGPRSSVQDGAVIHGTIGRSPTRVGAQCTIGHRAILHSCVVADNVIVGMGSIVMDDATIDAWTLLGAGALVSPGKHIPSRVLALGAPARVARELTDEDTGWITYSWQRYVEQNAAYRGVGVDDSPDA